MELIEFPQVVLCIPKKAICYLGKHHRNPQSSEFVKSKENIEYNTILKVENLKFLIILRVYEEWTVIMVN